MTHALHNTAGQFFQRQAVLPHFPQPFSLVHLARVAVGHAMAGNFVLGVQGRQLGLLHIAVLIQVAGVQVEGSLEARLVKNFDQAAVIYLAVIITERNGFGQPPGYRYSIVFASLLYNVYCGVTWAGSASGR